MRFLEDGLQLVAFLLAAFNILLTVLVVAAIALMFFLYVTKRQIVIIPGRAEQTSNCRRIRASPTR